MYIIFSMVFYVQVHLGYIALYIRIKCTCNCVSHHKQSDEQSGTAYEMPHVSGYE